MRDLLYAIAVFVIGSLILSFLISGGDTYGITKAISKIVNPISDFFANTFAPSSDTIKNIKFSNIIVKTLPYSPEDRYKTISIEFEMQSIGKEAYQEMFYYGLENNIEYKYGPVVSVQPTGLLPEDKKQAKMEFSILSDTQAKYLLVYDGKFKLEDLEAWIMGDSKKPVLFGRVPLEKFVTPIGQCRFNEECERKYCNTKTNYCQPEGYCEKNEECSTRYCNLTTNACQPENYCQKNEDCSSKYCDFDKNFCYPIGTCFKNEDCETRLCNLETKSCKIKENNNGEVDTKLNSTFGVYQRLAQSFVLEQNSKLNSIQVPLSYYSGNASEITLKIMPDETEKPKEKTTLCQNTIPNFTSPKYPGYTTFEFKLSNCSLLADTKYWFVLSSPNSKTKDTYTLFLTINNNYPNGEAKYSTIETLWNKVDPNYDYIFNISKENLPT